MKHSPGPWFVKNETDVYAPEQNGYICRCSGNPGNVPLIAASPELLAALKACCRDADYGLEDGDPLPPWYEPARAAIAKAEK